MKSIMSLDRKTVINAITEISMKIQQILEEQWIRMIFAAKPHYDLEIVTWFLKTRIQMVYDLHT